MSAESERLAVLENESQNMKEAVEKMDTRLSDIEKLVWKGIGILAALQIGVPVILKFVKV